MRVTNLMLTLQVTLTFVLAYKSCNKVMKRVSSNKSGELEGRLNFRLNRTDLKYYRQWQIEVTFDQQVQFVPTNIYIHQETGIIYHPGGGASSAAAPVLSIDNPTADVTIETTDRRKYTLSKSWGDINAEKLGRILSFSVTFNVTFDNPSVDVTRATLNDNVMCDGAEICGVSAGSRLLVHKGTTVQPAEFPWLAAIFVRSASSLEFQCGGTLVSDRHIVTAAHCVQSPNNYNHRARELIVYVGKHRLISFQQEPNTQVFAVSEILVHADWGARREGKSDADIAVLVLADPATFTEHVKPACLRYYEPLVSSGTRGIAVGWGETETEEVSQEPRAVTLPVVDLATCRASDPRYEELTSNRTFCAGFKDGSGPCRGDSGGGFVTKFKLPGDISRYELTGLVSRALVKRDQPEMCDLGRYAIFTLIREYRFWLRDDAKISSPFGF